MAPTPTPDDAPAVRRAFGPLLDRVGVVASSLCALHCAATPVLLAVAPTLGVAFGDERWEWPFLLASCALGAAALVPGFLRSGRAIALAVFGAGALLALGGKLSFEAGGVAESACSALGALGIACSHVLNLRVVRRGAAHTHAGGEHHHGACAHPPGAAASSR